MPTFSVAYRNDMGGHSVEVTADNIYEAIAVAIAEFRDDGMVSAPPEPETVFKVVKIQKPVEHNIRMQNVLDWAKPSIEGGETEALRRYRVRRMLGLESG
jgi:hypothetical protein